VNRRSTDAGDTFMAFNDFGSKEGKRPGWRRLNQGKRRRPRGDSVPWTRRSQPESCTARQRVAVAGASCGSLGLIQRQNTCLCGSSWAQRPSGPTALLGLESGDEKK
jgi:hypothetical protein